MHKLAEKIADCLKAKVEAKGIDNIEGQDLVELGMWTDIIKDLVCYDKDKKIIEAMDEAEESEEAMKYIEMYEDYPERKGYRGQPRSQSGRFMSRGDGRRSNRGRGGRRGYEDMMMYDDDWDEMERMRDMDRVYGRMGYSGSGSSSMGGSSSQGGQSSGGMSSGSSGGSSGGQMGYSESGRGSQSDNQSQGRYERAKRGYEETKAIHKDNSPESKQARMKEIEKMSKELEEELKEMLSDASQEEKSLIKQKLSATAQKI